MKKNGVQSVYQFSSLTVFLQIITSGLVWLSERDQIAVVEIATTAALGLALIYIERSHKRAFWANVVIGIMLFLLVLPLIRGLGILFSLAGINNLFYSLALVSFILEWVISFGLHYKKYNLERDQATGRFNTHSGRWYMFTKPVNTQKQWDLAKVFIPLGSTIGILIYRNTNSEVQLIVEIILLLSFVYLFTAISGIQMSYAMKLLNFERRLQKKLYIYWS